MLRRVMSTTTQSFADFLRATAPVAVNGVEDIKKRCVEANQQGQKSILVSTDTFDGVLCKLRDQGLKVEKSYGHDYQGPRYFNGWEVSW